MTANTKQTAAEFFRKYSDMVTEGRLPEKRVLNALYSMDEDTTTLHRMEREGWLDPESEVLLVQACKLLRQAVKISNSK